MKLLRKTIGCVLACAIVYFSSTISASALTATYPCGAATVTATLNAYSNSATASTSINHLPATVSVSIYGSYYKKGTSIIDDIGNGNGSSNGGTSASISNSGGTWISLRSIHSSYYYGSSVIYELNL